MHVIKILSATCFLSIPCVAFSQTIEWERSFKLNNVPGSAINVQNTRDGCTIVCGTSPGRSQYGELLSNGAGDYMMTKLDAKGRVQWTQHYGGRAMDVPRAVCQSRDGGYVVAGWTKSDSIDVQANNGLADYWVVKLNQSGRIDWERNYGGTDNDRAHSIRQTSDDGYIIAGYTNSHARDSGGNYGNTDCWIIKIDAQGGIEWEQNYGGSGKDEARAIQQTKDGGFIVAGSSSSNDQHPSENYGGKDYWVFKLNNTGKLEWERNYGGSNKDLATSIQITQDEGYIVAGSSSSGDGDVTNARPDSCSASSCSDYWVLKLAGDGQIQWEQTYGGTQQDRALSIALASDKGYIVTGKSASTSHDVSLNTKKYERKMRDYGSHSHELLSDKRPYWIAKLTSKGKIQWEQRYRGAEAVQPLADSGFVIVGKGWVTMLEHTKQKQWTQFYGGNANQHPRSIRSTSDEGIVVAGYRSYSIASDGVLARAQNRPPQRKKHIWIVKLGPERGIEWEREFGGNGINKVDDKARKGDEAHSVWQTEDKGFIVAGCKEMGKSLDYWIAKLDHTGATEWQNHYGGQRADDAFSIQQTKDGGFVVAGSSRSETLDVSGNNGKADFWVIKLNATGNIEWEQNYGGRRGDYARSIRETHDGGFIVAGNSFSSDIDVKGNHGGSDCWIVKLDHAGNVEWEQTYGGSKNDKAVSVLQKPDGRFLVAGSSASADHDVSTNNGGEDCWVIHLDEKGRIAGEQRYGGAGKDRAYTLQKDGEGRYEVVIQSCLRPENDSCQASYYWVEQFDSLSGQN